MCTACSTDFNFYFCGMPTSLNKMGTKMFPLIFVSLFAFSCSSFLKENQERKPLARVGERYLYKEDIAPLLRNGISREDSASFVTNYINNWASKQLLLDKARINLKEEKLAEFDALVSDYRTDLYTRAYKEVLVSRGSDTVVTPSQLNSFYEREKENFKLKEKLVQLRFVELPIGFLNKDEVTRRLQSFTEDDMVYLDSIGVQFRKLNFNDSLWIRASRVMEEIPPLTVQNQERYLKKSQFFELEDSIGVYLARINDVRQVNETAPLSFIEPTIKQVLLNRRKLDYMRKLEIEILDEAIKEKEFEVYEQNN